MAGMPEPRPQFRTRPVSWKTILSGDRREMYFYTETKKQSPEERLQWIKYSQNKSYRGRYPEHQSFLTENRGQIKVFVDIGCGIGAGAPTTTEARIALGEGAGVIAVDALPADPIIESRLKSQGIEFMRIQNIGKESLSKRLQQKCDAIRLAHVVAWTDQSERRRILVNIWKSLKLGGYLLGAHQYTGGGQPGEHQFVLRKTARGWEEILLE